MEYKVSCITVEQLLLGRYDCNDAGWNDAECSKFIESILLDLPLAQFVVAETFFDDIYTVVDGKKRLYALQKFTNGALHLEGLEILNEYETHGFNDLSATERNKFLHKLTHVVYIDSSTNEFVLAGLRKRLNYGSCIC